MKEQEFNQLLQQIEDGSFIGNKIEISGSGEEEDSKTEYALDDNKIVLLANALEKNPNITIVKLPHNNIGDIGAAALANVSTLETLELRGNNITVKGATILAKGNLKSLSLPDNSITYNNVIFENNRLFVSVEELQEMINAFIANKTIIYLGLNSCSFSNEENIFIAQLIKDNNTIKILNLSFNNLGDQALKYIRDNTTLISLDLGYFNKITDKGIEYIVQNTSLISLNLNSNKITDIGAELLSIHPSLKKLTLYDTKIGVEGARAFIGSNLDDVGINSNNIPMLTSFYSIFEEAKKLRDLNNDQMDIDLSGDVIYYINYNIDEI